MNNMGFLTQFYDRNSHGDTGKWKGGGREMTRVRLEYLVVQAAPNVSEQVRYPAVHVSSGKCSQVFVWPLVLGGLN